MPYIKSPYGMRGGLRIFQTDGVCWKCGNTIPVGTFNWSYNTRSPGKYQHQNCNAPSMQIAPIDPLPNVMQSAQEQLERVQKALEQAKQERKAKAAQVQAELEARHKRLEQERKEREQEQERKLQEAKAKADFDKALANPATLPPDITDKIVLNGKHVMAEKIKRVMREREYAFLYGAPGAGKTHLVKSLADDMGIHFALVSCSPDMLKSEILGSRSPLNGNYFSTECRDVWQNGGVILFDECGLAPGSFLNILNSALAQRILAFPDQKAAMPMHENCFIVFADNSTLYGNDSLFPERSDVGGAFRDRLTYLEFGYDTTLEYRILASIFDGNEPRAARWHACVQRIREALKPLSVPVFASPRFAYKAAKWFQRGFSFDEVMAMELHRGQTEDITKLVSNAIAPFQGKY